VAIEALSALDRQVAQRARIWLRLWLCSQCEHMRGESL